MLHTFLELDITACFFFDVGQTKYYKFSFFYFLIDMLGNFLLYFWVQQNQIKCVERDLKNLSITYITYMTSQGPWLESSKSIHFKKSNILPWYLVFNQEKRGSWIANSYYSTKRFSSRERKTFFARLFFLPTIFTWFKRHCIINRFLWGPFNVRKPFSSYIAKKWYPKRIKNNPLKSTKIRWDN